MRALNYTVPERFSTYAILVAVARQFTEKLTATESRSI